MPPKYRPYLTAVLGFAAAWMLKPSAKNQAAAGDEAALKNVSSHTLNKIEDDKARAGMPTPAENKGVTLVKDIPKALAEARASMATNLQDNLARRDQALVNRLTEVLNLTAEQQVAILELMESKREALNIMTNHGARYNFVEQGEKREKDFNDKLASILDQKQVEQLNQFRDTQAQNRVNAVAQREFADMLDKIDLTPEQQDKVLNSLATDARGNYEAIADKARVFADSYDALGMGAAVTRFSDVSSANQQILHSTNPEETMRQIAQERLQETENKLQRLQPLLSAAQYNQYKAMLDSKDQQFLANLAPMVQKKVDLNQPAPAMPPMPKEDAEEANAAPEPAEPEAPAEKTNQVEYVEQEEGQNE